MLLSACRQVDFIESLGLGPVAVVLVAVFVVDIVNYASKRLRQCLLVAMRGGINEMKLGKKREDKY